MAWLGVKAGRGTDWRVEREQGISGREAAGRREKHLDGAPPPRPVQPGALQATG